MQRSQALNRGAAKLAAVNAEALPYTLLIILIELAIGSLWVTLASDLRGGVTRGFVLTMTAAAAIVAGLGYWLSVSLDIGSDVDGYLIDPSSFAPMQNLLLVVVGTSGFYAVMVFMGWDPVGRIVAIGGSVVGVVCVAFLAGLLSPPAWGYAGVLFALLAGTLSMGAVTTSMTWGHWYLTEGSLPGKPMRELSWILIFAILLQVALLVINAAVPERITPTPANPVDGGLLANPLFWFRIGVGLVFAFVLAVLALRTAQIRSMQSATGLLYICMGAVFTGEVLARGVQFLTAHPI
ncbi:MAG: hypothetical protein CL897_04495 [Dehalococcoidia bacterium]|nr:hypothetical protein [Dehalococcoidia bacterium]HCV00887.1 hypothetical protein [Dehalococcoidia bacterium]|tara:strand:+ start:454 stop:1335 length:882 start_codon:yes stop_codon:yes gene_type:complete